MKKVLYLAAIFIASSFVYFNASASAENRSFVERFSSADKTYLGEAGDYNFDKNHSFIGFKVKHMGLIDVPGFFRDFTGKVSFDPKDVAKSSVTFKAMVTSIDTGVAPRDTHLRNADFFEVEKYPEMTFTSTKVEKRGTGWTVTGDLTMKGVTKSISIPFDIVGWVAANERQGPRMGIAGEVTINRKDFGVNYDRKLPNGTSQVSDEVKVSLQIEAVKPKEQPKPAA